MIQLRRQICILGGGPTALLVQILLREKGADAFLIAESALGGVLPMAMDRGRVNPLPVFLGRGTFWHVRMAPELLRSATSVTPAFTPVSHTGPTEVAVPGSYAEFVSQTYDDADRCLILTSKHLGSIVFQNGCPGLRRKVLTHYPQAGPRPLRLGYCEGVSPYLVYLEQNALAVSLYERVRTIDVRGRVIRTASHEVTYDRLISTIPLAAFLELAGVGRPVMTVSIGVELVVATTFEHVETNHRIIRL